MFIIEVEQVSPVLRHPSESVALGKERAVRQRRCCQGGIGRPRNLRLKLYKRRNLLSDTNTAHVPRPPAVAEIKEKRVEKGAAD